MNPKHPRSTPRLHRRSTVALDVGVCLVATVVAICLAAGIGVNAVSEIIAAVGTYLIVRR